MRIAPRETIRPSISLVAMIDVLMILLVFFMVTSTYLDLDMIPMVRSAENEATQAAGETSAETALALIRLNSEGQALWQGRHFSPDALGTALSAQVAQIPDLEVIVLPSGGANVQALVSVMDVAVSAGVSSVRVLRFQERQ